MTWNGKFFNCDLQRQYMFYIYLTFSKIERTALESEAVSCSLKKSTISFVCEGLWFNDYEGEHRRIKDRIISLLLLPFLSFLFILENLSATCNLSYVSQHNDQPVRQSVKVVSRPVDSPSPEEDTTPVHAQMPPIIPGNQWNLCLSCYLWA